MITFNTVHAAAPTVYQHQIPLLRTTMDSTYITFDDAVDSSQDNPANEENMDAVGALKCIDDRWYKTVAGKKARWMDLIGDYAGNERFILDGNGPLGWF